MPAVIKCRTCAHAKPIADFYMRRGVQRADCKRCHNKRSDRNKAARADAAVVKRAIDGGETLAEFGTPMQRCTVEALIAHGSVTKAAEALQLTPTQLRAHLAEVQRRAATRGYAPAADMNHPIPEGFRIKGMSTQRDADGNVISQWQKTERDGVGDKLTAMLDACARLTDPWTDDLKAAPVPMPADLDEDLLVVIPLGDPHLGMLAYAPEAGEHFDLDIAERQLYAAADHLINLAPAAAVGLLANLGDFFHADNDGNTTHKGTPVDVDTRYPRVYAAGLRLMRRLIDRMLLKFGRVHVISEIGNHDTTTALVLAICLAAFYENDPRVTIDTAPEPFHWFRFGKVFIGTHHGDRVKHAELGEIMACDRAQDWGETTHRHMYVGHVHHDTVKERRGVTVESVRTLASKDRWHHAQGYRSGRDLKLDVWHRRDGYKGRQVIDISLVKLITGDK